MPELHVVSWQDHGAKRWVSPASFAFTANDQWVAVGLAEVPRVAMLLPLAFARVENTYVPVALLGFKPGQNLVVDPEGRWRVDYVPLRYRSHPFRVARNADAQYVLCVLSGSPLVTDGPLGNRFFDDDRKPAEQATAIANALLQLEGDRNHFQKAAAILAEHEVFEPWAFRVQEAEGITTYDALFRLSEARLNALPAEPLEALRNCGGLMLAYAHLFSTQHVPALAAAAPRSAWSKQQPEPLRQVAALNIVDDNGTLSFAHL
jgi:hypothetical protein